jgi:cell wall-associated NlpC family hydrolase
MARVRRGRKIGVIECGLLVLLCSLPSLAADPATFIIAVPVANMYSAPTGESDVVSQALYGSNVVVIEEKPAWAKIETSDHYAGWISLDQARLLSSSDSPYASAGRAVQVSTLSANLYREPDVTAHRPVLTIPYESQLEFLAEGKGEDAGWLRVRLPDKQTAWIQAGDVASSSQSLSIDESIKLARRFIGVTYTWGGRSSFGFDCSGFTQMLVRSRGINMPRDADQQAAWDGVFTIDRKHLHAGDLLFFGSSADHITHTGMFIGHGQFIHDTTYGHPGVQISRLNDQPWTHLLVACRRVK